MTGEMQVLLGKYFSGESTAEEAAIVEDWAAADAENKTEFEVLKELWNKSGEPAHTLFDTEAAWQKVDTTIRPSLPVHAGKRVVMKRTIIGIAASVILLLGIWWLLAGKTDSRTVVADVAVKEVLLEDGSHVYLRKGASLNFPRAFTKNSRNVSLEGEAFFEVTANPSRPFVITAAATRVQVVGTSFSVNAKKDTVGVIVKTGRVYFTPVNDTSRKVLVTAGKGALYANHSMSVFENNDANFDAWRTQRLVFNNTPLQEVFRVINAHYHVNVHLRASEPDDVSETKITITFKDQPLESVLNELQLVSALRVRKVNEADYEVSKD